MSGIRINAGEGRGRKLRLVPGTTTRPVSDRVKQALFNIIGADIADAAMLDLFAGTGSVGIEALSRGARSVLFIDNSAEALKTVQFNLANTGYSAKATVLRADAITYLGQPRASTRSRRGWRASCPLRNGPRSACIGRCGTLSSAAESGCARCSLLPRAK